ncbi:MAG: cardiolipin synthase, partial [Eubacterium sp.]|nr:cardiolipin synthase [Eubacterium sp.]
FDDFGALMRTPTSFASDLRNEGIDVAVFNPIGRYVSRLYMNFRTHQKIVVVDGEVAYTGGFNIADEYANLVERFGVWKDAGVRIIGDAVWGMTITFLEMWNATVSGFSPDFDRYRPDKPSPVNEVYCHVLRDGPALGTRSFFAKAYRQIIEFAEEKLYVTTPYLILEDTMIDALIEARERGVDVRIITPNIPDKKRVKMMTEYNYGVLLKNGIRIFEYTPGFIHTKVIMNEHCSIVGTVNMDYRSFYLHYENGIWVYDPEFISEVESDFLNTVEQSREISVGEWKNRPAMRKLAQFFLKVFDSLV